MIAHQSNFSFLSQNSDFFEIPYFQRGYVWEQSNWKDLIEDLLDENSNHFLGSVILRDNKGCTDGGCRYSIIDGQQRITTISILIRVCYDTFIRYKDNLSEEDRNLYIQQMVTMISHWTMDEQGRAVSRPVIKHSLVDAPYYERVILHGLTSDEMAEITLDSEMEKTKSQKKASKSTDNNILKCYKYFYQYIDGNLGLCEHLKRILCENKIEGMIVKIDLDKEENEQAIFDTINTAGVRLSCSDTIKNSIFQKAMENAYNEEIKKYVISFYKLNWEETFASNDEDIIYWNAEISVGRYKRNNIEILFQSIALILGFYDPEKDPLYKLSDRYKDYLNFLIKRAKDNKKSPVDEVLEFAKEIISYAHIYRRHFSNITEKSTYVYDNVTDRLLSILATRGITALYPYILKVFKDEGMENIEEIPENLEKILFRIETYVVRSIICNESIANLNKECPILIRGEKTVDDYILEKDLNDARFKAGLRKIRDNSTGKMLLFWAELYLQHSDKKDAEKALFYSNYTLEHVMPQSWQDFWGLKVLPLVDVDGVNPSNEEESAIVREAAVYEIGNMALLSGSLNSSISNYEIERKINGDAKGKMKNKSGIRHYASLTTTAEIVSVYDEKKCWNEETIRERTNKLSDLVIEMWPM